LSAAKALTCRDFSAINFIVGTMTRRKSDVTACGVNAPLASP
jgi:hypothetical protein